LLRQFLQAAQHAFATLHRAFQLVHALGERAQRGAVLLIVWWRGVGAD
jgi:hypothetical protein